MPSPSVAFFSGSSLVANGRPRRSASSRLRSVVSAALMQPGVFDHGPEDVTQPIRIHGDVKLLQVKEKLANYALDVPTVFWQD